MSFQNRIKRAGRPIKAPRLIIGAVAGTPTNKLTIGTFINEPPPPPRVEIVNEMVPVTNNATTVKYSVCMVVKNSSIAGAKVHHKQNVLISFFRNLRFLLYDNRQYFNFFCYKKKRLYYW